jgi:hypothetical protein
VYYLFQAQAEAQVGRITSNWLTSVDLELFRHLKEEWHAYRCALINNGVILQEKPDSLKWTGGDLSGQVTVKNVYLASEKLKWNYKIGGWRKALWSWDCPLKIKLFIWLLVENKILTWEILQRRGFTGPSICKLCLKNVESTQHLFMECAFTMEVWNKLRMYLNYSGVWAGNNLMDCFKQWKARNFHLPTLPTLICWSLWREHNYVVFEDIIPRVQKVIHRSLLALREYKHIPKVSVQRLGFSHPAVGGTVGWFDGATSSIGLNSGAGGVIRISEQCSYKWLLNCGPDTNTRAELLGVWALLSLASRLSIQELHVMGDSKIIIDWLRERGAYRSSLWTVGWIVSLY